eukprot:gene1247-15626_t
MDASVAIWIVILAAAATFTFISNIFVFIAVYKCSRLQTRGTMFLLSLAASDFLVSCFNIPFTAASTSLPYFRQTGSILCDISGFFEMTFLIASVFSVTAMNVHRYIHLVHWSSYYDIVTKKRISFAVFAIWLAALILSAPPLFNFSKISFKSGKAHCFVDWRVTPLYTFALMFICFFLPVCIMGICYFKIYRFWKKSKADLSSFSNKRKQLGSKKSPSRHYLSNTPDTNTSEKKLAYQQVTNDIGNDSGIRGDVVELQQIKKNTEGISDCHVKAGAFVVNGKSQVTGFTNGIPGTSFETQHRCSQKTHPTKCITQKRGLSKRKLRKFLKRKQKLKPKQKSWENSKRNDKTTILNSLRKRTKSCPQLHYSQMANSHSDASDIDSITDWKATDLIKKNNYTDQEQASCLREPVVTFKISACDDCSQPKDILSGVNITVEDEPVVTFEISAPDDCSQPKDILSAVNNTVVGQQNEVSSSFDSHQQSEELHVVIQANRQREEEKKLTMMCIMIVAVFFISWFPFVVTMFVESLSSVHIPKTIDKVTLLIGYLNSLSNPLIYCYYNKTFRRQLKEQLFCKFKRRFTSSS